ncbi:MAG TPA: flagellar basal body P-ring formation chaperone FlgA [Beijerinckiaceae bacterium]|jgi:flagella basal body P-ring formation protein FlgA
MILDPAVPPLAPNRAGRLRPMIVIRIALAVAALSFLLGPAFSAETLRLRGEIVVTADVLTLADLAEGAVGAAAATPVFRAPAPGESGTIQARRIAEAAARFGLALEPGRAEVTVRRAARRIGADEIEGALRQVLELRYGIDARTLSFVHDGAPPSLTVAADTAAPVAVDEVSYDRRSRRVSALASVGGDRRGAVRIAGVVTELVETAVLTRALNRGETVQSSDFAVERRAKETLPGDVQTDAAALAGRIARRSLSAGAVVRTGDLGRPEIVARGDIVTVFYEIPGMTLTLRARATEAGAQGDSIGVLNIQSKKTLQATVVAHGKVAVSAATPGALAAAQPVATAAAAALTANP